MGGGDSLERRKQPKIGMGFGKLNIISLYRLRLLKKVPRKLGKYYVI
jgi:hypothetical protein